MKIVLDTSVVVAALMSRNGAANALLLYLFERDQKINVISNTLAVEIEAVLKRPSTKEKCGNLNDQEINRFIDDLCLISDHQRINFLWRPFLRDPSDDMVLETTFNAGADAIITYNLKDFANVEERLGIKVMIPKDLLRQIGGTL